MTISLVDPNSNTVPINYLNEDEGPLRLPSGEYNISKGATQTAVGVFLSGVTAPAE